MTQTGTEPGDFVELDLDEQDDLRVRNLLAAIDGARASLVEQIGPFKTAVTSTGMVTVNAEDGEEHRASLTGEGRLVLTPISAGTEPSSVAASVGSHGWHSRASVECCTPWSARAASRRRLSRWASCNEDRSTST